MPRFALFALLAAALTSASPISPRYRSQTTLSDYALTKLLQDASPIFGDYVFSNVKTANWMSAYPDSTLLTHMNIPGTHDSSTWNYSAATQASLKHITDLDGVAVYPNVVYRCQDSPFISMLNDGIRFFDLRFAFNPTNSTLVFWHSEALQSETATVPDVLFAFYKWLDDHPTETLLLSFMYESSTTAWAHNNAAVQAQLFAALTSDAAKRYIDQTHNALPTLGAARGKIILLRRFVLDQLNSTYEAALPGLSFPPSAWLDDNRDFSITYNPSHNLSAYIEDYYEPDDVPAGLGAATNIAAKLNATAAHLQKAASGVAPDGLFITFSSAERDADEPAVYPKIMALGNGTDVPGVNQQLVPVIQGLKGKRLGVVVLDFFEMPGTLVPAILGI